MRFVRHFPSTKRPDAFLLKYPDAPRTVVGGAALGPVGLEEFLSGDVAPMPYKPFRTRG